MAASLLGTWAAAEGSGALTNTGRTSTAGSLITASAGVWTTGTGVNLAVPTDSKSNTYTEQAQQEFSIEEASFGVVNLCYNNAGTRGTSHTISKSDQGNNSLGAAEWSGIAASPTISSTTTSSASTSTPSATATPSVTSLVVGVMGYDSGLTSGSTTIAVSGSTTQAYEVDENNDQQAQNCGYRISQSASSALNWTLGAAKATGVVWVAFEETATAVARTPAGLQFIGRHRRRRLSRYR